MAVARITKFELDDYGTKVEVFEIEYETALGWKSDDDHSFGTLEEAKSWLAANGHELRDEFSA